MENDELDSINVYRVLDKFLEKPDSLLTYDDLKGLRGVTAESRIREALGKLVHAKILNADKPRGRRLGDPKKQDKRIRYEIKKDLSTFRDIFTLYLEYGTYWLCSSQYTDQMIKQHKFYTIYESIGDKIVTTEGKRIYSEIFLSLPATIREYKGYAKSIYNCLEDWKEADANFTDYRIFPEIWALECLDPLIAVPFYREHAISDLVDFYKKIGGRRIKSSSESVIRYNELDMYLGPYFSYPIYDPLKILFSKPFDRLYEDVYIFNENDLRMMAERIHLVYKNFAEFLSLYFEVDWRYTALLEKSIREYIFLWNCASTYFDDFYFLCGDAFRKGSGHYYITSNSGFMQVIDLIDSKNAISRESATHLKTELKYPPLYMGEPNWGGLEYDPFEVLLPCERLFEKFGFDRGVVPIEDILADLKPRLDN